MANIQLMVVCITCATHQLLPKASNMDVTAAPITLPRRPIRGLGVANVSATIIDVSSCFPGKENFLEGLFSHQVWNTKLPANHPSSRS